MERTIYMTYLHDNRLTNTVQVFKSIAKLSYFSFCYLVNTPDFVRNITKGYSEYICEFKIKEDIESYIIRYYNCRKIIKNVCCQQELHLESTYKCRYFLHGTVCWVKHHAL